MNPTATNQKALPLIKGRVTNLPMIPNAAKMVESQKIVFVGALSFISISFLLISYIITKKI